MTGIETSANDGYGRKDLIHARNRLSTRYLPSQSDMGLAIAMKAASAMKYTTATAYERGLRTRFTPTLLANPNRASSKGSLGARLTALNQLVLAPIGAWTGSFESTPA